MFIGLHAMAAQTLNAPELEISDDEGKLFMKSAQDVMRHYSVQTTQKTLDTVALMGVVVGIYGPRLFALQARRKAERGGRAAYERRGPVVVEPHRFRRAPAAGAPDPAGTDGGLNIQPDMSQPGFDGSTH